MRVSEHDCQLWPCLFNSASTIPVPEPETSTDTLLSTRSHSLDCHGRTLPLVHHPLPFLHMLLTSSTSVPVQALQTSVETSRYQTRRASLSVAPRVPHPLMPSSHSCALPQTRAATSTSSAKLPQLPRRSAQSIPSLVHCAPISQLPNLSPTHTMHERCACFLPARRDCHAFLCPLLWPTSPMPRISIPGSQCPPRGLTGACAHTACHRLAHLPESSRTHVSWAGLCRTTPNPCITIHT